MEIINLDHKINDKYETGIALGNFDGFHIGHTELIKDMVEMSRARGLKSSLLLFENHTKSTISNKKPSMLTSNEQKYQLAEDLGVDIIFKLKFTKEIMSLSENDFIESILVDKISCKLAVVGFDYRFGHKAKGTSESLKEIGKTYGIETKIIEPVLVDEEVISSTKIREFIKQGQMEKVAQLLGRNYAIVGEVVSGDRRGTKMGIPTANLKVDESYAIPIKGVYATDTIVDGKLYKSITDIGVNPTFEGNKMKIETNIFDFDEMIYGENIEVIFKEYMRDDIRFDSKEDLIAQMNHDIEKAKTL